MSEYVEIVNWDATRRHYATQAHVEASTRLIPGLCGMVYGRTLEDDRALRMRHLREKNYAALPLCKFCERKAQ